MLLLWLVVGMLAAVLVFEAGDRWRRRQERKERRRLDAYMQARTDERVRALQHHDFRGQGG